MDRDLVRKRSSLEFLKEQFGLLTFGILTSQKWKTFSALLPCSFVMQMIVGEALRYAQNELWADLVLWGAVAGCRVWRL